MRTEEKFKNNLVNFLQQEEERRGRKFFSLKKILFLFFIGFFIIGFTFSYQAFSSGGKVFGKKHSFFSQVKKLVFSENKEEIQKQKQINILLLGMRGTDHQKDQGGGNYLSDTNILLSIRPEEKKAAMLSIPRDLFATIDGFGKNRINASYALNLEKYKDGDKAAEKTIEDFEKILGVDIQYYVKIDFVGFEKTIDILGGVDINIEKSFTDSEYPDLNYGYQTISFEKGLEHMDGDRALKFVRSRHGNGGEGSDFARAKRQQQILSATKDKALSFSTLLNPIKINRLIASVGDHVRTDMELNQAMELFNLCKDISSDQIINQVIDNSNNGLLYSTRTEQGAYVLIPNKGEDDFSEIQELARNIFEK